MGSLSHIPGSNIIGRCLNCIGMCDSSREMLDIAVPSSEVLGWPNNLCRVNLRVSSYIVFLPTG